MILEFSNGKRLESPDDALIKATLLQLDSGTNNTLTLYSDADEALRIVKIDEQSYSFILQKTDTHWQSAQLVPYDLAETILLLFARGDASWEQGIQLQRLARPDVITPVIPSRDKEPAPHSAKGKKWFLAILFPLVIVFTFVMMFISSMEKSHFWIAVRITMVVLFLSAFIALLARKRKKVMKTIDEPVDDVTVNRSL